MIIQYCCKHHFTVLTVFCVGTLFPRFCSFAYILFKNIGEKSTFIFLHFATLIRHWWQHQRQMNSTQLLLFLTAVKREILARASKSDYRFWQKWVQQRLKSLFISLCNIMKRDKICKENAMISAKAAWKFAKVVMLKRYFISWSILKISPWINLAAFCKF